MTIDEARARVPRLRALRLPERGHQRPARAPDRRRDDRAGASPTSRCGRGGADYFSGTARAPRPRAGEARRRGRRSRRTLSLSTSTTNGCNIVLAGLALGADDEIVTTDGEHFGLLGALAASPAQVRVAAVRDLPPEQALDVLLGEVTPKTRLLALSHVCWMSGNRFPVTS